MRIAVDGAELCGRPTGVGRYLATLLHEWVREDGEEQFVVYVPERPAVGWPEHSRLTLRELPRGAAPFGAWWQQVVLARALRRDAPDVLFAPADALPLGFAGRSLLTVHDLAYFARPEWFGLREGARRRWLTRRSIEAATRIVAVSEFTRDELTQRLEVPAGRIAVVPHGRAPWLDRIVPTPAEELRQRVWQDGRFALMVGSIFERRRIDDVLEAFRRIDDLELGLVIAGADRRRRGGDLGTEISARGLDRRVTWIDYCEEADLVGLYRAAHHLIYLSEYEGFGLPPLEAMGFGLPVIVSDCAALREVYGEVAELVPVGDPDALAARIRALVTDPERLAERAAAGRRLAAQTTAAACARQTLALLRDLKDDR